MTCPDCDATMFRSATGGLTQCHHATSLTNRCDACERQYQGIIQWECTHCDRLPARIRYREAS